MIGQWLTFIFGMAFLAFLLWVMVSNGGPEP